MVVSCEHGGRERKRVRAASALALSSRVLSRLSPQH